MSGLTNLDYADLRFNLLNVAPGSLAMTAIETLQNHGTAVDFSRQQILLGTPARLGGNQIQFTIQGTPDAVLEI